MKLRNGFVYVMAATLTASVCYVGSINAQEGTAPDPAGIQESVDQLTEMEQESPSLSSPAAALHAENLAKASASKAQAEVTAAQKEVAEAEAALNEAKNSGNQAAIDEAQARFDAAVQALDEALANSAGVSVDEISEMRSAGMGWGQIAHELGVHPGSLGLGHTKEKKTGELEMATARNTQTGLSKGYGSASEGKGAGLSRADSKQGIGRGADGKGAGKGGDRGSDKSGGKGGGKSGGNGGGKGK